MELFCNSELYNLFTIILGHIPILLDWLAVKDKCISFMSRSGKKMFRFKNIWAKERECREIVATVWAHSG